MYDTIIIGAGMSGLAAGIRLAHFDRRVCLLERHSAIGGLNSFYHRRGRDFDVGLHALTNFTPKGARQGPLARLLRQLRLGWEELALAPQMGSAVVFPGIALEFTNDIERLRAEVHRLFPRQKDNFERLLAEVADYDRVGSSELNCSAMDVVGGLVTDQLLTRMVFCPLQFYGSAREGDMDFGQFSIMFRSIFLEGLARPYAGVRLILNKLLEKFEHLGGEIRLRAGVKRIGVRNGKAQFVVLDDGTELPARQIVSSAGWRETLRLCDDAMPQDPPPAGQVSFVEAISVLDTQPSQLGLDRTITFFNDSERFEYARPDGLVDLRSGVICSPNNFAYDRPLSEGMVRITALANFDRWVALDRDAYRLAKLSWYDRMIASAVRFVPDFRHCVVDTDVFTPTTIRRFTGHENGAVYGAPQKQYDGTTPVGNLYLCGTDQGFVGIIGSLLSGITVVNKHLLR